MYVRKNPIVLLILCVCMAVWVSEWLSVRVEECVVCVYSCQIIKSSKLTGSSEFGWRVRQFHFHVSTLPHSLFFRLCYIVWIRVLYELFYFVHLVSSLSLVHFLMSVEIKMRLWIATTIATKRDFFASLTPLFSSKKNAAAAVYVSATKAVFISQSKCLLD